MKTFSQLCELHQCDKGKFGDGIGHGYDYDPILGHLRDQPIRLLEVGVGGGASIKVWLDYFTHPATRIYGIDNDPHCAKISDPRYVFTHGDQCSLPFWTQFLCSRGYYWDITIDDGAHTSEGMITQFECVWPYLQSGSIYVIEDLKTSYQDGYQVKGWPRQMAWIKGLLDDINAQSTYAPGPNEVYSYPQGTDGSRGIKSFRMEPEIVVLVKA